MNVLKQKRMYEKQRDQLSGQLFNIDQTKFAQNNVKETAVMVAAMKATQSEIKASFKEIKIDDVENLHDDMSDLLEDADEINEIMGRQYGVPENIDEDELAAELNALDDEIANEELEEPSYLQVPVAKEPVKVEALPSFPLIPQNPVSVSSTSAPPVAVPTAKVRV